MKIPNRKNKFISDKLFYELVMIYIFQEQAEVFEYELESFVKKSKRTIYRYIEDLNKTDLFRCGGIYTRTTKEGLKKYSPYEKDIYASDGTPLLMLSFCLKHPKGLDSDDPHIVKLTRCALLMHELICARKNNIWDLDFWNDDFEEDPECLYISNEDVAKVKEYYYNELNFTYSEKTFKRDLMDVLIVIYYMGSK